MDTDLDLIYAESLQKLRSASSMAELEEWYRETLSRKGRVYLLTRQVGQLSKEERPVFGKVRYMNAAGLKRKFDADKYVKLIEVLSNR